MFAQLLIAQLFSNRLNENSLLVNNILRLFVTTASLCCRSWCVCHFSFVLSSFSYCFSSLCRFFFLLLFFLLLLMECRRCFLSHSIINKSINKLKYKIWYLQISFFFIMHFFKKRKTTNKKSTRSRKIRVDFFSYSILSRVNLISKWRYVTASLLIEFTTRQFFFV